MIKFWKPFRVVISLIVLLLISFIFVDFRQHLPSHWYKVATWLQFIPSAREFFITFSILSAGFIIISFITLLIGRVYCSVICPLGIIQDVISYISRKLKRKIFRFKFAKPKTFLRYLFLAIAVIPIFFGTIFSLGLLDPYSNFGRFFSDLGRPLYMALNNLLANILIKFKVFSLSPENLANINWVTIIYPVIVLALIIWLAGKWGRLYCNSVCPVGTFLGLLSRFSVFKIKIDQSSCTKCAQCAFVCKSQCISVKDQEIDFTRCVGCFNCLKSCDSNSITYKFALADKSKPSENRVEEPADESKRGFIISLFVLFGAIFGITRSAKADIHDLKYKKNLKPVKKNYPCSPPGSKSIDHFNDACTACHLCISACPGKVLQTSALEYGLVGFMQPFMDPSNGYCNFECTQCSEVCPNGAILPLTKEEKKVTQIGQVHFIKENCVVYLDETLCGACAEHCPTKAVTMVPYKEKLNIPKVDNSICVGCGACEHACPVRPHRAIYVDGNPIHKIAEKPKEEKLEQKELEEFPF